jgi:3-deoxy-D-manno-octulosonate cytidylyltransferase
MRPARRPTGNVPEGERIIGVIPARFASTRFPGKPLAPIAGKPMIRWVYEAAARAKALSAVVVATDDERIKQAVEAFGGTAMLTSGTHRSGTDRVAEVAGRLRASHYINIQGDEPLIGPDHIDAVGKMLSAGAPMATLATRVTSRSDLFDQNVVKVVVAGDGAALYFSRHAIPFPRKYLDRGTDVDLDASVYLRHLGTYGYTRAALLRLAGSEPCEIEELESLEQLRALHLGIRIQVGVVEAVGPCVDVPGDITKVENLLATRGARQWPSTSS